VNHRILAVLALLAAGCSAAGSHDEPGAPAAASTSSNGDGLGQEPTGPTGQVGLQLVLPGDAQIATVNYTIAGPNGSANVVKSGQIDVHAAGGTAVLVTLQAATGYRIALSASSVDAGVSCSGVANFDIQARATTKVAVQLACSSSSAGGHTTVINGTSFDCAAWGAVTASPDETMVGNPVSLTATATGPMPANLTYAWSAPSGQFGTPDEATTTFTCTQPGTIPITIVVGDGPVPAGSTCNAALDTDTITVTCSGTQTQPDGGTDGGTMDAGGGTDGGSPPPPPAPALPLWGAGALAVGIARLGTRRKKTSAS
jgi:hypothetical protein